MGFVTAETQQPQYDVIVVGSGAGGGQAAYTLCLEGARVLMLEAGRHYTPESETPMYQTPEMAPLGGVGTTDKPFGFYDATIDGGWEVPGEPYTQRDGKVSDWLGSKGAHPSGGAEAPFEWWRTRMLGGRTNHWGRISLRNGPYDFKPYSRDGLGFDWPIGYQDVAPYYDKVELLIGVYGSNEGLENTPDSSPGCLLPPPAPIVSDHLIRKHAAWLGIPMIPGHRAVLTRALDHERNSLRLHPHNARARKLSAEAMRARAPCVWATPCGRGCSIRANYQSPTVHLPPALASGNLDITTDAMVYEVMMAADGRATGVRFINRLTGAHREAHARVVVLAASACETARILLNSRSAQFPDGVANSSGKVGRYLMDTVGSTVTGQVPRLEGLPPLNEDGAGGHQLYAPWWGYRDAGKLGFARGYHIEFGGGKQMPGFDTAEGIEWLTGGSYGRRFKEDVRRYYGSFVGFDGRGEMIPNEQSYCEIDPGGLKDKWGIPVLRFQWQWSEHEMRQAAHMQQTFGNLIEAMGGRMEKPIEKDGSKAISPGGSIIHEVGGAIMGADRRRSVTNAFGQAWDVPNLFIADGAVFASNADKNPTLTIMALAWRTCDHILERLRRREL